MKNIELQVQINAIVKFNSLGEMNIHFPEESKTDNDFTLKSKMTGHSAIGRSPVSDEEARISMSKNLVAVAITKSLVIGNKCACGTCPQDPTMELVEDIIDDLEKHICRKLISNVNPEEKNLQIVAKAVSKRPTFSSSYGKLIENRKQYLIRVYLNEGEAAPLEVKVFDFDNEEEVIYTGLYETQEQIQEHFE